MLRGLATKNTTFSDGTVLKTAVAADDTKQEIRVKMLAELPGGEERELELELEYNYLIEKIMEGINE